MLDTEDPGFLQSSISCAYIPSCAVGLAKEAPLADQSASGKPATVSAQWGRRKKLLPAVDFIPLSLTTNHYLGGVIVWRQVAKSQLVWMGCRWRFCLGSCASTTHRMSEVLLWSIHILIRRTRRKDTLSHQHHYTREPSSRLFREQLCYVHTFLSPLKEVCAPPALPKESLLFSLRCLTTKSGLSEQPPCGRFKPVWSGDLLPLGDFWERGYSVCQGVWTSVLIYGPATRQKYQPLLNIQWAAVIIGVIHSNRQFEFTLKLNEKPCICFIENEARWPKVTDMVIYGHINVGATSLWWVLPESHLVFRSVGFTSHETGSSCRTSVTFPVTVHHSHSVYCIE